VFEQLAPNHRHELAALGVDGPHRSAEQTTRVSITARSAGTIKRLADRPRQIHVVRSRGT
jgi:hypothetical protein